MLRNILKSRDMIFRFGGNYDSCSHRDGVEKDLEIFQGSRKMDKYLLLIREVTDHACEVVGKSEIDSNQVTFT